MTLKVDFKDEILADGKTHKEYDLVDDKGTVLETNLHLVRKDIPREVGSEYGAKEINNLNEEVNGKMDNIFRPDYKDITKKPTVFDTEWDKVSNKPSTFPPEAHNHDNLYFTKVQADNIYINKINDIHIIKVGMIFNNRDMPRASIPCPPGVDRNSSVISIMTKNMTTNTPFATGPQLDADGINKGAIYANVKISDHIEITLANAEPGNPTKGDCQFEVRIYIMNFK